MRPTSFTFINLPLPRPTSQALKHLWLQKAKHAEEATPLDPEVLTSLRDFAKFSAFKRAALEAIAFSMSAQSISHLREQFSHLDKDNTGFVSLQEFLDVLQRAGEFKFLQCFMLQAFLDVPLRAGERARAQLSRCGVSILCIVALGSVSRSLDDITQEPF